MSAGTQILEHTPEDMTAMVEAGITLAALQNELGRHRQWLPIDPPHPERITVADVVGANLSGPRRFGYGTVRDHLIGIKVAPADGTVIHSGGKVVKNVAGYDLMKLFIGARGSLGTVLEATFKLRPLSEQENFVELHCDSLEEADNVIKLVLESQVAPIVLDLVSAEFGMRSAESGEGQSKAGAFIVVLGFAGTREEVDWQLAEARGLGFDRPSSLDFETKFWSDTNPTQRISVLPSKLIEALRGVNAPFVARAGNGVIYHRGAATQAKQELPLELMRRLKLAFDPKHVLPEVPLEAFDK